MLPLLCCPWYSGLAIGTYRLATGTYRLAKSTHRLARGTYRLAIGTYRLAIGTYRLAIGTYRLAIGTYRLATGTYRLAKSTHRLARGTYRLAMGTIVSRTRSAFGHEWGHHCRGGRVGPLLPTFCGPATLCSDLRPHCTTATVVGCRVCFFADLTCGHVPCKECV